MSELLTPRNERIVVEEIVAEQVRSSGIVIASGKQPKAESLLRLYRIIAVPLVTTDRLKDLVVGDKVLIRKDDVSEYSWGGKTYGLADEDFVVSHLND